MYTDDFTQTFHVCPVSYEEMDQLIDQIQLPENGILFFAPQKMFTRLLKGLNYWRTIEYLIDRIVDKVTRCNGTLVIPAPLTFHIVSNLVGETDQCMMHLEKSFDPEYPFSELLFRKYHALRSIHPLCSVVAIGKDAREIVGSHHCGEHPFDCHSPYSKILEKNARVLFIGQDSANNFLLLTLLVHENLPYYLQTSRRITCSVYSEQHKENYLFENFYFSNTMLENYEITLHRKIKPAARFAKNSVYLYDSVLLHRFLQV